MLVLLLLLLDTPRLLDAGGVADDRAESFSDRNNHPAIAVIAIKVQFGGDFSFR
jgi:hypothetical protein